MKEAKDRRVYGRAQLSYILGSFCQCKELLKPVVAAPLPRAAVVITAGVDVLLEGADVNVDVDAAAGEADAEGLRRDFY